MTTEDQSGDDPEQEQKLGEARVQQLVAKTLERYGRLLRRLANE